MFCIFMVIVCFKILVDFFPGFHKFSLCVGDNFQFGTGK